MGRKRGRRRALKLKLKKETIVSIVSLAFILSGILMIISFAGQGALLSSINEYLSANFGFASLVVPFILISAGLMLTQLKWTIAKPNVLLGSILVFAGILGLGKAGNVGSEIYLNLSALILPLGASIILIGIMFAGILVMTESSLAEWLQKIGGIFKRRPATIGDLQKRQREITKPTICQTGNEN